MSSSRRQLQQTPAEKLALAQLDREEGHPVVNTITPEVLLDLIEGQTPYACLDIRAPEVFRCAHIPGASLIPYAHLQSQIHLAVPCLNITIVVYDHDGQQSVMAATLLEDIGYQQVGMLTDGFKSWMDRDYPTGWSGHSRGESITSALTEVKDTSLATRVADERPINTPPDADAGAACDRYGTASNRSAWLLIKCHLETDTDRLALRPVAPEHRQRFETRAATLARNEAIRFLDIPTLRALLDNQNEIPRYLIDVRTASEYVNGHIPGFRWFPTNPTRPYADEAVVMQNCPLIFCCDGTTRATVVATWFEEMGYTDIYTINGGTTAWEAWGLPLELG